MTYEITCPQGHRLQVTEAHIGQSVNCPTCNESFTVPDLGGRGQPVMPAPPDTKTGMDPKRWTVPDAASKLSRWSLVSGRPMVAVGLVLVLLARGCDGIGKRGLERADMKVKAAKEEFDDGWQTTRLDLERQVAVIEESKEPKAEEQKKLADLKSQLSDLDTRQAKARKAKESGDWRAMELNARTAKANYQINGYWREMFFVFASIVLSVGLLTVSWTAQGAERWVSLIMLAIITFSIYVGGTAWFPVGRL